MNEEVTLTQKRDLALSEKNTAKSNLDIKLNNFFN